MRFDPRKLLLAVAILTGLAIDDVAAQVSPSFPTTTPTPTRQVRPRPTVNLGGSGGSGSGMGFGIGAAGLALGVGVITSLGRQRTYSGENSTQIVTGPPESASQVGDQTQSAPKHRHHVRLEPSPQTPETPNKRISNREQPRAGFVVPKASETRYVPGEILLVTKGKITPQRLKRLETAYGLTPLGLTHIDLIDADIRRYGLKPGVSVGAAVTKVSGSAIVIAAQPNYRFELQIDAALPAAETPPDQYAVDALHLVDAHRIANGTQIRVAIIDSGIDETNPDVKDSVVERFDAVGGVFKPHSHGTAIGGAIVAHHTLVGIAPKARLLAIRAFSGAATGANGTSYDILRGLDFAAAHGAQIVNMSFAGPEDRLLAAALDAARKRGIITVAAAGNGGPLAKPLYPAAEPGTIAVTATDADGKLFVQANRGRYVSVAAPGVNIVAPGLGNSVQITSGTSIATAEASGVVALILERNPGATPDQIHKILSATARRLKVEPGQAGAGLIDARAAVSATK